MARAVLVTENAKRAMAKDTVRGAITTLSKASLTKATMVLIGIVATGSRLAKRHWLATALVLQHVVSGLVSHLGNAQLRDRMLSVARTVASLLASNGSALCASIGASLAKVLVAALTRVLPARVAEIAQPLVMSIEDYGRGVHMLAHEDGSAPGAHYNDEAPASLIRARAIAGTLIGTSERSAD